MKSPNQSRDIFVRNIFSSIAPRIDFLSSLFSFDMDTIWRRKLVSLLGLKGGERVLDVCAGTGKLAFLLAKKVGPRGAVFGADFCKEMVDVARSKPDFAESGISFVLSDAKDLTFTDEIFDAVTVAFGMRNIPDTSMALHEARRVLKPGGRFFCLELTCPEKTWLMPLYNYYCFYIMPTIAKKVLNSDIPYNYLPRSIKAFPSADNFRHTIEKCGFSKVAVHPLSFGIATIFGATKN